MTEKKMVRIATFIGLTLLLSPFSAFAQLCKEPNFNNFLLHKWSAQDTHFFDDKKLGLSVSFISYQKKGTYYLYPTINGQNNSEAWKKELKKGVIDAYEVSKKMKSNEQLLEPYNLPELFLWRSEFVKGGAYFLEETAKNVTLQIIALGNIENCFHKVRFTSHLPKKASDEDITQGFREFNEWLLEVERSSKINIKNCPDIRHPTMSPYDYCFGSFKWDESGDTYTGEFRNDKANGRGIMKWGKKSIFAGQIYIGDFRDNKRHGMGKYIYPSGSEYIGEVQNDQRSGVGVFNWVNGDRYLGNWVSGKKHGTGKLFYKNGGIYEGEFSEGIIEGQGEYTFPKGSGERVKYTGEHQRDLANGHGVLIFRDGSKYEGTFKNDQLHGPGKMTEADGTEIFGIWKNGVLQR